MRHIFSMDTPIMRGLSKLADIIVLNILFIICSIPVFTIGASLTALYAVMLRLVRNEESYIVSSFFRSFKMNFRISTEVWLLMLAVGGILAVDYRFMQEYFKESAGVLRILLAVFVLLYAVFVVFIFPYIARFEDTFKDTVRNVFLIGVANLLYFAAILAVAVIPFGITYLLGIESCMSFWLLFLFAGVAYVESVLYRKVFDKYTGAVLPADEV